MRWPKPETSLLPLALVAALAVGVRAEKVDGGGMVADRVDARLIAVAKTEKILREYEMEPAPRGVA